MSETKPHLATQHEQYPEGFPVRINDALLGHWPTPTGMIVVEDHPHGYEVHFEPCYDFENCDACSPDRPPHNPHTTDGHHFRECSTHGAIVTVAGGIEGYKAVLEYLSTEGSEPHMHEFAEMKSAEQQEFLALREQERVENEAAEADSKENEPSIEERLLALEAELVALRRKTAEGLA